MIYTVADYTIALNYSSEVVFAADIDGDGDLDLVVKIARSSAKIFKNDRKGNFSEQQYMINTSTDTPFVISDINGDKYPDIVARDTWLNDGKGEFYKNGKITTGTGAGYFISEGFNNYNSQDLFVVSRYSNYTQAFIERWKWKVYRI